MSVPSNYRLTVVSGLLLILVCCLVGVVGCQGSQPVEVSAAEAVVVVDPLNPPAGRVTRVWRSGDSMVNIGTEVGVTDGDWLSVVRGGKEVQLLEVSRACANISYCRVATRENPIRPKVDDQVVLEPKNLVNIHETPAE